MRGCIRSRSLGAPFALLFAAGICAAPRAHAIDLVDGRLHVNGYLEAQVRTIARDFQASDDWDLTQWYNVLDVEIEADIAPDGWGPFSLVSGFARVEARYDCVWTRGCGMFSSADAYGDRADHLPGRLSDGRRAGYRSSGTLFNGDTRRFAGIPRDRLAFEFSRPPLALPPPTGVNGLRGAREASRFFDIEGIDTLFDTAGVDDVFGNADDPAPFIFDEVLRNCQFGFRRIRGREDGVGHQVLGPWNPGCRIDPTGRLRAKPNPLSATDLNPVVLGPGNGGFGALPLRPVPEVNYEDRAPKDVAKGIYLPNSAYAELIRDDELDNPDQTFRQAELEWNHGASQQDEKELKELYLDLEFLDSRLWIRAGKQTIVWGKTELFRNQDQFNPQDVALASLPSLEESRIALWALRGVWSFYDVGPLEDVRLELAGNYDQFEPTDLGRCGEPYSPLPVCDKTYGLFIHGLTGLGVAGEVRPDNPWSDVEGIEGGARLEFRWDRFSFALTDFYGFGDLPYQDVLYTYSRNVDPATGRPRHGRATGPCTDGSEDACLDFVDDDPATPLPDHDALRFHSVNQQVFAMICATSVGLSPDLDPTACGQTVFNSHRDAITGVLVPDPLLLRVPTVAGLASNLIVGNEASHILAAAGLTGGVAIPRVQLNADPCDGFLPGPCDTTDPLLQPNAFYQAGGVFPTMNQLLTVEQMAALGCGPFYGTNCEADGVDLMNAEASALLQSWPGFEGAGGLDWDTADPSLAQPGTLAFDGGPVCTRFEGGELRILPGCRGPTYQDGTQIGGVTVTGSPWDPNVDGDPTGLLHPFFDPASPFFQGAASALPQEFRTELGALSFNALMALVALSTAADVDGDGVVDPTVSEFDPSDPFRADGCSFSRTHLCSNVQSVYQVTGLQRNTLRAGGSPRFGRRDFVWQGGSPLVLRYDKRNVMGFSLDFAEDRTKSSWGVEFTWVEGVTFADWDARDRTTTAQTFNTTISIDRPTFINFLNANRTFFLNSQWFVQWVDGYRESFPSDGPWNVLATFTVQTGFFRDRFQSNMTFVYDFGSNSGAWLPSVTYRYTENFSVTFGAGVFAGRMASRDMPLSPTSMANRAASHAYDDFVENGLSVVRERDELFLRVRYTY